MHRVTQWPGQEPQSRIPSLIWYDSNNQVGRLHTMRRDSTTSYQMFSQYHLVPRPELLKLRTGLKMKDGNWSSALTCTYTPPILGLSVTKQSNVSAYAATYKSLKHETSYMHIFSTPLWGTSSSGLFRFLALFTQTHPAILRRPDTRWEIDLAALS